MILATLGTHPARMLAVEAVLVEAARRERVVLQCAAAPALPGVDVRGIVAPGVLRCWIREARHVVCHAGPASLFECWEAGVRPIVVPRDPTRREHVDDHQLRFAARLERSQARVVRPEALLAALDEPQQRVGGASLSEAFASDFGALVDALVVGRRR